MWRQLSEFQIRAFFSPRNPRSDWKRAARRISGAADNLQKLSDQELLKTAAALRYRARSGESLMGLLFEAAPLVVEAARRHLGIRHYPVQLLGGIALHHGCVAEMQTGEGKTLVATLPLFVNALGGLPVHLATANDYLARRDADWMRPVYESLGLTVGVVTGDMSPADRRHAYDCDITYGTAREFGFDYLRDRLTLRAHGRGTAPLFAESLTHGAGQSSAFQHDATRGGIAQIGRSTHGRITVQRHPLHFALIDEADSLLIDEARTPLIISTQSDDQAVQIVLFRWCALVAPQFVADQHLDVDDGTGQAELNSTGIRLLRSLPTDPALNSLPMSDIAEGVVRAVQVSQTLLRDQHYVVRDGAVCIVDEYTGRVAEGRKWRNGVHQAVEAREGVAITPMSVHCARITVQELFGLYDRVAGMTGTAGPAAVELYRVYGLPVVRIPTRRPSRRIELPPCVLPTAAARWEAVADEVRDMHGSGRPVLIGTRTIEQSECLSALLESRGLEHEVLNARNHASEAEIVSQAGSPGRVTVATNMAGRGTDIALQGEVQEHGGLHVICSEPHSAGRIDRQLAGRCGRQGDPGSFRQYMSLEDGILRTGLGDDEADRLRRRATDDPSRVSGMIGLFTRAQRQVERRHEEERELIMLQARQRSAQLLQLGQDPWLDAV